jgi:putative membrane protein
MRLILRLLANAGALAVATAVLKGIYLTAPTFGRQVFALLVVALIFGILNAVIKPIFALVTAPLLLITLGLFLLVINACMLLLTSWVAGKVGLGWHVSGFWVAVVGAIIVSIVSFVLNAFVPGNTNDRRRA